MSLELSDIDALRAGIEEVLQAECSSAALHAFADGKLALDASLWKRAAELGWLGLALPEDHGGLGLGAAGAAIFHQALGRFAAPGPFISTTAGALWIAEVGTAQQKQHYLPRVTAGELKIAVPAVLTSAPLAPTIRMLGACDSALAILPVASGVDEVSWGLVELDAAYGRLPTWDDGRDLFDCPSVSSDNAEFIRDPSGAVRGSLAHLLAVAIASDSFGLGRGVLDFTIGYMKEREQFGRPIGSFQALKHRVADMHARLSIGEQLVAQAVDAVTCSSSADLWPILAKAMVSADAVRVAGECLQLHGGVGFTWDFDVHFFLRRARLNEALLGGNQDLLDCAAQAMLQAASEGRAVTELEPA